MSIIHVGRRWLFAALLMSTGSAALADTSAPVTGIPPLSTMSGGPFDNVDLANLNVHFSIPIFSRPGIGKPFVYNLTYDSLVWVPFNLQGSQIWAPVANWGWRAQSDATLGYVTNNYSDITYRCGSNYQEVYKWSKFVYHDAAGTAHPFPLGSYIQQVNDPGNCYHNYSFTTANATDDSGYILKPGTAYQGDSSVSTTVLARGGLTFVPPSSNNTNGNGSVTDPNGNAIRTVLNGSTTTVTDTLGTPALTIIGSPPNDQNCAGTVKYQYNAPGAAATVIVYYKTYWVQTNFIVSGISEFPATHACLVDHIVLPDTSSYSFTYETAGGLSGKTTGRIASITLPTGGVINYSYNGTGCGNNSNCMMADGSPSAMHRTYAQYGGTWTYTRGTQPGQQLPQTTTQVIDPDGDETDLNFSGVYELSRYVYQGRKSALLKHTTTTYNGCRGAACETAAVTPPISEKSVFDHFSDPSYNYWVAYDYFYDQNLSQHYGLLTTENDFDYREVGGNGVIRSTQVVYDPSLCSSKNICDHPDSVEITDGNWVQKALTTSHYDGNGNALQVDHWVNPSTTLYSRYSYNANGTLKTATDPKGTLTDYYSGNYSCNGAFPNQVSVAGLTTTYTYNCTGGVLISSKDPNNATTSLSYTDPYMWRPAKTTDPLGRITYYNYYRVNNSGSHVTVPGQTESVLSWTDGGQGAGTLDDLNTVDAYGRTWLQQSREGLVTGYWDTTNYFYDTSGRLEWLSRPIADSAGTHSGGGIPSTGYFYDGLGRITEILDWSGLDIKYSYNADDIKIIKGGGQTFSKQLEYDALGRLTSVCELSNSLPGVAGCGQSTDPGSNGYKTTYGYDPLGDLLSVNQSGQTRSFTYDGLNRLTQENNPEAGVTSYQYDYPSRCWEPQSQGDLTEKTNASVTACYYYDALHRLTDVGNTHQGPNNPCLRFRYDNSSGYAGRRPLGINPAYTMGRLVEAATDECDAQDPILADEWFSYSPTGDATDLWESTPHSGGWYHTVNGYAPSGAIWQRAGFLGTGTTTRFTNGLGYVVDGEGRLNGLWDQSLNQSVWWGTTYNPAGQPDRVAFSSGDYETFSWDQTSGRMSQWKSVVGSKTQTGNLNWSANGTLYQLAISDTADTANSQTCTNNYDDLERLTRNACQGTAGWSQTFTYDAFGNIKKTGSDPFTPSYGSNNRIAGSGFSYDGVGNVTNDGSNIYSYGAGGRPVKVNDLTLVNDAFDRTVEIHGQFYHDFVYSPDGWRLGRMSGQTVEQVYAPLAGGLQAVYGPYSSGKSQVLYWRHSDWLGSSRLASTPSNTVYFDGAYAPYAENYAGIGTSDRSFTGKTMDSSAGGIYDFPMRQYSQTQGRWNVPDPAGLAAVDPTDPQTWNRYAYVGNRPLNNTDPLGLFVATPSAPSYWDIWGNLFTGSHPSAEITLQEWDDTHPRHTYTPITITVDGGKVPEVPTIPITNNGTIPSIPLPNTYPVVTYGCGHGADCSNGNTVPGYSPQDGICSAPVLPLNANPLAMGCCTLHDLCYAHYKCNESSWEGHWSSACQGCNIAASACVIGSFIAPFLL